jgi:3',5'-cyclic AMP phosphodiesterase CpdA
MEVSMLTIRSRALALPLGALLALLIGGCAQAPRPAAPRPASAKAAPAAPAPAAATAPAAASLAATAATASTAAAPAADVVLRFAAYGDTRDGHDVHRTIVANVMRFQPALVLQTGDLVHHGSSAEEWKVFDDITGAMRQQIAYYPARGNHDVAAEGYYEQRVTQPVLSGNKLYYSLEKGSLHFVAIDTQQPLGPESDQGRWLEADLAQAEAAGRFIVPFFHQAIFSVGRHAIESDVLEDKAILHPLFRHHGVRLAFEGHDHLYYRTVRDGITYVVTGGGGAPLYQREHPEVGRPEDVYKSVNHFCIVDVHAGRIVVNAYESDLTPLDHFEVALAN